MSRLAHAAVLGAIGAALAAGLLIHPDTRAGGTTLSLFGFDTPSVCMFRNLTGLPCAGCGLTRSLVLLLHGEVGASIAAHPLGVAILGLALLQIPPRLAGTRTRPGRWVARWDRAWLLAGLIVLAAMALLWAARLWPALRSGFASA